MSLPHVQSFGRTTRVARTRPASEWSYLTATEPKRNDEVLVFFRIHLDSLRIDDLAEEVRAYSSPAEALRWRRTRAQEYAVRLRDRVRLHLPTAEVSIYVHEGDGEDRLKVILASFSENAAALEADISERAEAIQRQAWSEWRQALRVTMLTLRQLDS